jgi:hypothetical protein
VVIQKKTRSGVDSLLPWESLVYCLWAADYGMRNAGNLEAAAEVHSGFHRDGRQLAEQSSLPLTQQAFALSTDDLEDQYFERFEAVCDEIQRTKPVDAVGARSRRSRRC